jgi:hypothetical protein
VVKYTYDPEGSFKMSSTVTTPAASQQKNLEDSKPKVYELNSKHRCDRCGEASQAYVKVVMATSGLELFFCKHHYNKYELALLPITDHSKFVDESGRLDTGNRLIGSENS